MFLANQQLIELHGLTQKGKNWCAHNGILHTVSRTASNSPLGSGLWISVKAKNTQAERWVKLLNDQNFRVNLDVY